MSALNSTFLIYITDNKLTLWTFHAALGLRNPLAVQGAYPPGAFGLPPPGVNGDLPGGAGYGAGLHLVSPQMNGAAAAAAAAAAAGYGRSPMVSQMCDDVIHLSSVTVMFKASTYSPVSGHNEGVEHEESGALIVS